MNFLEKQCTITSHRLDDQTIRRYLSDVEGWVLRGTSLTRTFTFPTYLDGVAFVAETGRLAVAEQHHPTITITYTGVAVETTTHDAGGLTENDFILAAKINALYSKGEGSGF